MLGGEKEHRIESWSQEGSKGKERGKKNRKEEGRQAGSIFLLPESICTWTDTHLLWNGMCYLIICLFRNSLGCLINKNRQRDVSKLSIWILDEPLWERLVGALKNCHVEACWYSSFLFLYQSEPFAKTWSLGYNHIAQNSTAEGWK